MARKKKQPDHLQPPAWLRKEARSHWNAIIRGTEHDGIDRCQLDANLIGRLAHVECDLQSAEEKLKTAELISTAPNGVRYPSAEVKMRDQLAAEHRQLLKLLLPVARKAAAERQAMIDRIMESLHGEQARTQELSAGERQAEARARSANLSAQDFQREQEMAHEQ